MKTKMSMFFIFILFTCLIYASPSVEPPENTAAATKYVLEASLLPEEARSSGKVVVNWQNNSSSTLNSIPFAFINPEQEQDLIKECKINGKTAKFECRPDEEEEAFTRIEIIPPAPVKPDEKLTIKITYLSGNVRNAYGFLHYTTVWFPMALVVYGGEVRPRMQALSEWEVTVSYPSDYKAALSGEVISREESDDKVILKTKASDISNYGVLLSKAFIVEEDEVVGVKIRNYYFKGDEKWSKKLMEMAKDVISFYKEHIGFYPQPVLSILPGYPNRPAGGYPICANCIVIHRALDLRGDKAEDFARWITAHEIGHQYWGFGYVLESFEYPSWFGLSMGIYTDRLYSRARGLDPSFYESFRHRYMGGVLAGVDTTVMQKRSELEEVDFDWNNVIAHGKSFAVLTMLESVIGEKTFLKIFKTCLDHYKGKNVTLEMFQETCEDIYGKDLGWFFYQWYQTPAILDYRIMNVRTSKEGEAFLTECTIERKGDAVMPVEIALECADGESEVKVIKGWEKEKIIKFITESSPVRLLLDPEDKLPLLCQAEQTLKTIISGARQCHYMTQHGEAVRLLRSVYPLGKDDPEYLYWLGREYRYVGDFPSALKALRKLMEMEKGEHLDIYFKPLAVLNIGITYDQMGKREEAITWYEKALQSPITNDSAQRYLKTPYSNR